MLIKEIVDFENFFHSEFYKSKCHIKQLSKDTGFSSAKIIHWLDLIGPGVTLLDALKAAHALGFYVSIEKIGQAIIPSVWIDYPKNVTCTTTSNVTDGSVRFIDMRGKILVDNGGSMPSVKMQHKASDIRVANQLKVLKKSKKSKKSKKAR